MAELRLSVGASQGFWGLCSLDKAAASKLNGPCNDSQDWPRPGVKAASQSSCARSDCADTEEAALLELVFRELLTVPQRQWTIRPKIESGKRRRVSMAPPSRQTWRPFQLLRCLSRALASKTPARLSSRLRGVSWAGWTRQTLQESILTTSTSTSPKSAIPQRSQ